MQLNEVLHHPAFQKLEARWRGLKYLMDQSETGEKLKIKVFNVSKKELLRRPAARAGVRSERSCSRRFTKRSTASSAASVRRVDRRLRVRQASGRYGTAGEGIAGGVGRPRAVPHGRGSPELFNLDSFTSLDRSARPGEDLRHHGIRQVEELPRSRRFPLRGAHVCRTF